MPPFVYPSDHELLHTVTIRDLTLSDRYAMMQNRNSAIEVNAMSNTNDLLRDAILRCVPNSHNSVMSLREYVTHMCETPASFETLLTDIATYFDEIKNRTLSSGDFNLGKNCVQRDDPMTVVINEFE